MQYIRKLLFSDLDKSSIEHVLRQLRKLPWSECEAYLLKCFMKVHKGKYGQIHLIASLTAGLSRYHDEFAVAVVDEVGLYFFYSLFVLGEIWQFFTGGVGGILMFLDKHHIVLFSHCYVIASWILM